MDIRFNLKFNYAADADAFHQWADDEDYTCWHYQLDTTAHFCTVRIPEGWAAEFNETWDQFIVSFGG
jgi:hypothetical protein